VISVPDKPSFSHRGARTGAAFRKQSIHLTERKEFAKTLLDCEEFGEG